MAHRHHIYTRKVATLVGITLERERSGMARRDPQRNSRRDPQRLSTWFWREWRTLAFVTATGVLYNVGLGVGPWLEGRLAQTVADLASGTTTAAGLIRLALVYVITTAFVQAMRALKRLYVRKFANKSSRAMKKRIYASLLATPVSDLAAEDAGTMMTKALSDVDDCVEGMRKFTTELFDTGVALATYLVMLLVLDWRLTLLCLAFPTVSYVLAARMRRRVTCATTTSKRSAEHLSLATLERVEGAVPLRAFGEEATEGAHLEGRLADFERAATRAGVLTSALQPLYMGISCMSCGLILWLGGRNVLGTGWAAWDIAALTTFLTTYLRLAKKSSTAAKLFNAVQRASVSWERIRPFMAASDKFDQLRVPPPATLEARDLTLRRADGTPVVERANLTVSPSQIVGVTGRVACGKTFLGLALAGLAPHEGTVTLGGRDLKELREEGLLPVAYLGHDPELLSDTIAENVQLGRAGSVGQVTAEAGLEPDLADMPQGLATPVGEAGIALSGGQRQRVGLARTLLGQEPVLVLDDPFSAVDRMTEAQVLAALRRSYDDRVIVLISHRLELFHQLDSVVFLEDGHATQATHAQLLATCPGYRSLVQLQQEGGDLDEQA